MGKNEGAKEDDNAPTPLKILSRPEDGRDGGMQKHIVNALWFYSTIFEIRLKFLILH